MSVVIESVTIGSVEDRRFKLTNSQAARFINVGTSWNTIRVGIRFSIDDLGSSLVGTPRLYVGMISSPASDMSNGPLGITTSHFVGYINASNLSRQTSGGIWYSGAATSSYAKKIGNTITATAGSTTNLAFSAQPTARRSVLIVQIVKGSPNYQITYCAPSGSSIAGDVPSKLSMLGAMESDTTVNAATYLTNASGNTYTGVPTGPLAVDEGVNGVLNAICVAWSRSDAACYISDIAWARMA